MIKRRNVRGVSVALALLWVCLFTAAHAADAPFVLFPDQDPRRDAPDRGRLEAFFINVEAADCTLLRCGGLTMLIDAGNADTAGRAVAYMQSIGVEKIDIAFMTHPHTDHIAGFAAIHAEIPIGRLIMPERFDAFQSEVFASLRRTLERDCVPVTMIASENEEPFGGATLSFYQWDQEDATVNDRSMILVVKFGDRALLMAADVENQAQAALTARYGELLRADIIKMPHHGLAPLQRELNAAARPELAVFTNYKHRLENPIRLAEQRHMRWLLTTKGNITAVTDGEVWQVWQDKKK